jgi:hypothetical protein
MRNGTPTIAMGTCYQVAYTLQHGEDPDPEDVSAGTLAPVFRDCDGFGFWQDSGFTLSHTPTNGWTFSTMPAHIQPREWDIATADRVSGEYVLSSVPAGDCFFTGTMPAVGGPEVSWTPRGSERDPELSAALSLSAFWPRWERSASAGDDMGGEYATALDGAAGTAFFGYPGETSATSAAYYTGSAMEAGETGEFALCH